MNRNLKINFLLSGIVFVYNFGYAQETMSLNNATVDGLKLCFYTLG
ncbi:MAG: hypothetical protein WEB30_01925 [Cyclobacteriaceae bacterium]